MIVIYRWLKNKNSCKANTTSQPIFKVYIDLKWKGCLVQINQCTRKSLCFLLQLNKCHVLTSHFPFLLSLGSKIRNVTICANVSATKIMGVELIWITSYTSRSDHGWYRNCVIAKESPQWIDVPYLFGYVDHNNDNQRMSSPFLSWLYYHCIEGWQ